MDSTLLIFIISILILIFIVYMCFRYPSRSRAAFRIRAIIIVALIITIIVSGLRFFGPRGLNSLFGPAGQGMDKGSDDMQTYKDGVGEDDDGEELIIVVKGDTITVGDKVFDPDYAGLDQLLEGRQPKGRQVYLVDDYALSGAYHFCMDLLEDLGAIVIQETR